ncbi:uncharacterized protein LOC144763903 [Lissotriton helveticus]
MGRRRAPGKKMTAQCSCESIRATVPSLPLHDVSTSRSRNDAQRDQDLEPLSENLPHIILLSMLEELEAKLENLMNTVKDVPSRVAGLIKKIWIEKDQGSLDNGAVTLEVVCPANIRDCAVSRSPATPQLDRPGEPSLCLQPVFSDGHAPKQDCTLSSPTYPQGRPEEPNLYLQPMFPYRCDPQQDQSMQPGFPDVNESPQDECIQPVFPDIHESQQDQCLQPGFPDVNESQQDKCMQTGFPDVNESQRDQCMQPVFPDKNGVQQDCTLSSCPQTDLPGRSLESKRCLHSECVDGQAPEQDQSVQSAYPEKREPDGHLKQEPSPLSANSWDQQQNLCPHPLFPEGHEPQQNHRIQPTLPDGTGPDDPLEEELMCFDFQDPQENRSLQPLSPDGMSPDEHLESVLLSFDELGSQQTQCLQQHLCLKQGLPYVQDSNVNYELESMRPEAQESDKNDNLEMACTDAHGSDQKYKLGPLHTAAQDRELESVLPVAQEPDQNNTVEPLHPEEQDSNRNYKLETPCTGAQGSDQNNKLLHSESQDQHQNCKPERLCPEERGQSVPPSFLELDTNTTDEDSLESGNTKSPLLPSKATPEQQSHLESMNVKESH